ncbi:MAG TPA: hypothetical protein VFD58_20030 [Blastocatellia bacterium]|nr:hypothetical protein [Blastocatellia bacterium]
MKQSKAAQDREETTRMNRRLVGKLTEAVKGLDIHPADKRLSGEQTVNERRRRRLSGLDENIKLVSLTEVNGVLLWEDGIGTVPATGAPRQRMRRMARRGVVEAAPDDEVVTQFKFERLEPSQVGQFLARLDDKFVRADAPPALAGLSDPYGLRRWDQNAGQLKPETKPTASGRILIIIHGTFSNATHLFDQLKATTDGKALLAWAAGRYDQILAFDHPTVSISPVLNSLDLARLFADSAADVDVICHSRGGLVTRWWLETFDHANGKRRAVLVGSPLRGTSLAAPDKLRAGLNLLTNVGRVLETASGAAAPIIPFMSVVMGLLKVCTSITGAVGNTPLIDAAVAMIPGLAAQSMTDNNPELNRLNTIRGTRRPDYFVVRSDFEPKSPGWKFWEYFVGGGKRLTDTALDLLVFKEANDLVVDTSSMTGIAKDKDLARSRILDFGTSNVVHHTNYFLQPETLKFIANSLK